MAKRTDVANPDLQWGMTARFRILVEKAGYCQVQCVSVDAIDRRLEQSGERCYRHFWDLAIITQCIEERVLEFGYEKSGKLIVR